MLVGLAAGSWLCRRTSDADGGTLHVFAAASLREAFQALETDYEAAEEVDVVLNFAGSNELQMQIRNGAPADVFAAADFEHVRPLASEGLVEPASIFACNDLVLVVPKENPAKIREFADLPKARRIAMGVDDLPIGRYAAKVLDEAAKAWGSEFKAQVEQRVVSRELTVKHVLAKVALGEVDAGFVYRTDMQSSDRVSPVEIPARFNVVAQYPVAVVARTRDPAQAKGWIAFLRSKRGRAALHGAGFVDCDPEKAK